MGKLLVLYKPCNTKKIHESVIAHSTNSYSFFNISKAERNSAAKPWLLKANFLIFLSSNFYKSALVFYVKLVGFIKEQTCLQRNRNRCML